MAGRQSRVAAVAMGVVSLLFPGGKLLVLNDCLYVPNVRRNPISVSCLSCNGFLAIFNKNLVSIKCNANESMLECWLIICIFLNQYLTCKLTQLNLIIREKNHPQLTKPSFGTLD